MARRSSRPFDRRLPRIAALATTLAAILIAGLAGPASAADAVISKSVTTATAAPVSDIDIATSPLSFTCQVWIAL